jgi:hypothetical protein
MSFRIGMSLCHGARHVGSPRLLVSGQAHAILQFTASGTLKNDRFAVDDGMSPLDLSISPDGNVLVSSEFPFGSHAADTSIRE